MGLLRGLIFSLLLASTSAWALNNDELFAGAREAYKVRDEAALAEYTRQLHGQNYILAPYADYWLLLLRLSQADHQTVQDFLQRYPDVPFADRVRGEWLKQLGKRQDWQNFVDEYLHFQREDTAVSCYAVEARVALGESVDDPEAEPQRQQPPPLSVRFALPFQPRVGRPQPRACA